MGTKILIRAEELGNMTIDYLQSQIKKVGNVSVTLCDNYVIFDALNTNNIVCLRVFLADNFNFSSLPTA